MIPAQSSTFLKWVLWEHDEMTECALWECLSAGGLTELGVEAEGLSDRQVGLHDSLVVRALLIGDDLSSPAAHDVGNVWGNPVNALAERGITHL